MAAQPTAESQPPGSSSADPEGGLGAGRAGASCARVRRLLSHVRVCGEGKSTRRGRDSARGRHQAPRPRGRVAGQCGPNGATSPACPHVASDCPRGGHGPPHSASPSLSPGSLPQSPRSRSLQPRVEISSWGNVGPQTISRATGQALRPKPWRCLLAFLGLLSVVLGERKQEVLPSVPS